MSLIQFLFIQLVHCRSASASAPWNCSEIQAEGDRLLTLTTEVVETSRMSCTPALTLCLKRHTSHLFILHQPKQGIRHTCLPDAQKAEATWMSVQSLNDPCDHPSNTLESRKGSERPSPPAGLPPEGAAFLQFVDRPLVLSLCGSVSGEADSRLLVETLSLALGRPWSS